MQEVVFPHQWFNIIKKSKNGTFELGFLTASLALLSWRDVMTINPIFHGSPKFHLGRYIYKEQMSGRGLVWLWLQYLLLGISNWWKFKWWFCERAQKLFGFKMLCIYVAAVNEEMLSHSKLYSFMQFQNCIRCLKYIMQVPIYLQVLIL